MLSFLNFALFPFTSYCLARICSEQCQEMCITSSSCVCLPLYNISLIVFLNCKPLWIKASAKLINVILKLNLLLRLLPINSTTSLISLFSLNVLMKMSQFLFEHTSDHSFIKPGKRSTNCSSYRPVSLLSNILKH